YYSLFISPLCSILFPYTTLFRSYLSSLSSALQTSSILSITTSPVPNFGELFTGSMSEVPAQYPQLEPDRLYFGSLGSTSLISRKDRKSTRLNSSHVSISYAVFCL